MQRNFRNITNKWKATQTWDWYFFNNDIDLTLTKDACFEKSNSSYNYVITKIFHTYHEEYIEFKKYITDPLSNLSSGKSEQTNNNDDKIKPLEKQLIALTGKKGKSERWCNTQLRVIETLCGSKELYRYTSNQHNKKEGAKISVDVPPLESTVSENQIVVLAWTVS